MCCYLKLHLCYFYSALVVLLIQGCIVVQAPPIPHAATASSIENNVPSKSNQTNLFSENNKVETIADAIATCKRLQESESIPIICKTDYTDDGSPVMFFGFTDFEDARKWISPIADNVGNPFCKSANSNNRQAFVGMGIEKEKQFRIFNCELDEWGEWTAIDDDEAEKKTVAELRTACSKIHNSKELPIGCSFEYDEAQPMIAVAFEERDTANEWSSAVGEYLLEPFCEIYKADKVSASFILVIGHLASAFDCESEEWSDPVDISGTEI